MEYKRGHIVREKVSGLKYAIIVPAKTGTSDQWQLRGANGNIVHRWGEELNFNPGLTDLIKLGIEILLNFLMRKKN